MIRALFRFFLLLVLATRLTNAQPLPDRVPLSGLALDSAGKPLAGAVITLRRQESNGAYTFWGATTASDARGAWRFAQAEAGRYYLSAEAPGFAPVANQSLDWKAGEAPLRLRFERLLQLQLKVLATDGKPLVNTPLWVRLRGDGNAGQVSRRALSDAEGMASLDALLPATYALYLAAPRGFAIQNGLSLRENQSLDLTLQPGGTLQIGVSQSGTARGIGGATLSLTPENGAEAARALGNSADWNENLALLAAGGDPLSLVSRDGDGQIEIANLPPGRYLARLNGPGQAPLPPQSLAITLGQTTTLPVLLPLLDPNLASLTLNLRFKDASGIEKPAAPGEWSVRALPIDQNGALAPEAEPDTLLSPGGNISRRAQSNPNGQITLFPLRVGRYRVFVAPRTPPTDEGQPEAVSLDVSVAAPGTTATLVLPAVSDPEIGSAQPAPLQP